MKTTHLIKYIILCALLTVISQWASAQGTAFTYQGQLTDGGTPANGSYDITFTLYSTNSGGVPVAGPLTNIAVVVSNGLFITTLDFGDAFDGSALWLEIAARRTGTNIFATLAPRQPVTPTPYAVTAANIADPLQSGIATTNFVFNTFTNLAMPIITNYTVTAATNLRSFFTNIIVSLLPTNNCCCTNMETNVDWHVVGNLGTVPGPNFLGTIDNQALELHVNSGRALRLEPNGAGAPNVIGGSPENQVDPGVAGAVVSGGGAVNYFGAPYTNRVSADFGAIGGGRRNLIDVLSTDSAIGGGSTNTIGIASTSATIDGGSFNTIQPGANGATVGGGLANSAASTAATIVGGANNVVEPNASAGTIGGGDLNVVQMNAINAVIAGGHDNTVQAAFGTIGGGENNFAWSNAEATVIGGGAQNVILYFSKESTIGGGLQNSVHSGASYVFIGGGDGNSASSDSATIAGGINNGIQSGAVAAAIGGGAGNAVGAPWASIAGGTNNSLGNGATASAIGGGEGNAVPFFADHSTISGGYSNIIQSGAFNAIGGGNANSMTGYSASGTIGGGAQNVISLIAGGCTIGGGEQNNILSNFDATISGGKANIINGAGEAATIGGGYGNSLQPQADFCTIGGGIDNLIQSCTASIIAGGDRNAIYQTFRSTIGGGSLNTITNATYATIPGGFSNVATNYAFAAGNQANAIHSGAFVWSDDNNFPFYSSTTDEFAARATGGVRFVSAIDSLGNPVAGVQLMSGSGSWTTLSDRNAKENFHPVNPQAVLDRVAALPVATWNYKTQSAAIRHMGPTAQDFKAAFAVGETDTGISTVDENGVALAAIQGLNQKLEGRVGELKQENAELKQQLADLRALVQQLARKQSN
jgi:hypothetical protein